MGNMLFLGGPIHGQTKWVSPGFNNVYDPKTPPGTKKIIYFRKTVTIDVFARELTVNWNTITQLYLNIRFA